MVGVHFEPHPRRRKGWYERSSGRSIPSNFFKKSRRHLSAANEEYFDILIVKFDLQPRGRKWTCLSTPDKSS